MTSEQVPFDGMPTPLYAATPSRLTTYLDCPRRYRMAYLERPARPKGPPWAHHSVGAAVHTALAKWWTLPKERRTPEMGGLLVASGWLTDGFRDDRQSHAARDRARDHVVRYLRGVDPSEQPLGIERTVSLRTARASLWGRVDRIDDRAGEGVVIVDYKTGRSQPSVDDARRSLALAIYAAAASRIFRRACARVELHHLPSGAVVAWDHTEETMGRHLRRADASAAELGRLDAAYRDGMTAPDADTAFPAHVGTQCGWCDFRASCESGRSVPAREPWAGLDD